MIVIIPNWCVLIGITPRLLPSLRPQRTGWWIRGWSCIHCRCSVYRGGWKWHAGGRFWWCNLSASCHLKEEGESWRFQYPTPILVLSNVMTIVSIGNAMHTTGGIALTLPTPVPLNFSFQALVVDIVVSPLPRSRKKWVTHALSWVLYSPSMSSIIAASRRIVVATKLSMDEGLVEATWTNAVTREKVIAL